METEKELNKVLADIYSDLEKLQSAREQVEIVTESSKELTLVTSTLLKELKEFSNQFGKENSSNISQLTKSLNDFESKINKISEKGNQSIDEYIVSFKKQIIGVIEQFSQQIANNEKNLNAISNLNNEKIGNKIEEFEKTTKDLKINAEKGIEEIKAVAISKISLETIHEAKQQKKDYFVTFGWFRSTFFVRRLRPGPCSYLQHHSWWSFGRRCHRSSVG